MKVITYTNEKNERRNFYHGGSCFQSDGYIGFYIVDIFNVENHEYVKANSKQIEKQIAQAIKSALKDDIDRIEENGIAFPDFCPYLNPQDMNISYMVLHADKLVYSLAPWTGIVFSDSEVILIENEPTDMECQIRDSYIIREAVKVYLLNETLVGLICRSYEDNEDDYEINETYEQIFRKEIGELGAFVEKNEKSYKDANYIAFEIM